MCAGCHCGRSVQSVTQRHCHHARGVLAVAPSTTTATLAAVVACSLGDPVPVGDDRGLRLPHAGAPLPLLWLRALIGGASAVPGGGVCGGGSKGGGCCAMPSASMVRGPPLLPLDFRPSLPAVGVLDTDDAASSSGCRWADINAIVSGGGLMLVPAALPPADPST